MDIDNPHTDIYAVDIKAEDVTDKKFRFIFKVEHLIVLPGDYNIGISSKLLSNWMTGDINYWIALETSSTFDE